jgi:FkbM family methyltransferase
MKTAVKKYLARRLNSPEIQFALERLDSIGFRPAQIFDVGAYKGDFARMCSVIWPKAGIACFEALQKRVDDLQALSAENANVSVYPVLLGATSQDAVILNESETASSILTEKVPQQFAQNLHPMTTVDEIVSSRFDGKGPDLLKLDVQGYELEVLKGAENTLLQTKAILAEVNLLDIHENVPLLAELVRWLDDRGWVAYDICGLTRRPLDKALWQADFIFVPRNSPLRSDKHWSV